MIYLRELTRHDVAKINDWRNHKGTVDYLVTPFRFINLETDELWFDSYMKNRGNQVRCAICLKESNEMIGVVYLLNIDMLSRNGEFSIFIGATQHRDKGVGEKATKLMMEYAFMQHNLHRVYLSVLESNERAIHMYKKVGFRVEGTMKEAVFKNNKYSNVTLMSFLKNEYIAKLSEGVTK